MSLTNLLNETVFKAGTAYNAEPGSDFWLLERSPYELLQTPPSKCLIFAPLSPRKEPAFRPQKD